jgi:hypothetical protein
MDGEAAGDVARDLGIRYQVLWEWRKRVIEKGEDHLYELGRPKDWAKSKEGAAGEVSQQRRIAELERVVGQQQQEIRFLDNALRRVEERRHRRNGNGGGASSKP